MTLHWSRCRGVCYCLASFQLNPNKDIE
jgi:hypothetical protein